MVLIVSIFGGSELRHGANLRCRQGGYATRGDTAPSVTGPADADYRLTGGRIMTTSHRQKLMLRLIVLLAICASMPLCPTLP